MINTIFSSDGANIDEIETLLDAGAQINLDEQRPYYVSDNIRYGNLVTFLLEHEHYNIFKLLLEKTDQMLIESRRPLGKIVVANELYYALIAGVDDKTLDKILSRLQKNHLSTPGNNLLLLAHKQFSVMSRDTQQQKFNMSILEKYCPSIDFDRCFWDAYIRQDLEAISQLLLVTGKQIFSSAALQKIVALSVNELHIRFYLYRTDFVLDTESKHQLAIFIELLLSMLKHDPEKRYTPNVLRGINDISHENLLKYANILEDALRSEKRSNFIFDLRWQMTKYIDTKPFDIHINFFDEIKRFNLFEVLGSQHVIDKLAEYPGLPGGHYLTQIFNYIRANTPIMPEYHAVTLELLSHFANSGYSKEMLNKLANAIPETNRIQYLLTQGISHELLSPDVYTALLETLKDTHWVQVINLARLLALTINTVTTLSVSAYSGIINAFLFCMDLILDETIALLVGATLGVSSCINVGLTWYTHSLKKKKHELRSENENLSKEYRELIYNYHILQKQSFFKSHETLYSYSKELQDYLTQFENSTPYTEQLETLQIDELPENIQACPITMLCPNKPVFLQGEVFDFDTLIACTNSAFGWKNPMTKQKFYPRDIQPARNINNMIQDFIQKEQVEKEASTSPLRP